MNEALSQALEGVSKAASDLGHYLFRICIDGKLEEIELYDLPLGMQRTTEKRKGRPYSRDTLRSALKQLVERGLVIIDRNFGGGVVRLTVRHPGERIPFSRVKNVRVTPSISSLVNEEIRQKYDSNPDSPVTITENIKGQADTSPPPDQLSAVTTSIKGTPIGAPPLTEPPVTANPEFLGEGEENIVICSADPLVSNNIAVAPPPDSPSDLIDSSEDDPRLVEVAKVVPLNPQLRAEILKFSLEETLKAIAVFLERRQKVDNPEGFLIKALRQGWQPRQTKISATPSDFNVWYKLANECDVVKASTAIGSQLHVLTANGWQPWESVSSAFPIPLLREMLGKT
jgi:hypothetical protein